MAQDNDTDENVFELSPFEVNAADDQGYVATGTLAGSRLNTSLMDTPAAISVMTTEFLSDIGATSINEAIEYGVNAGNDIGGGGSNVGASTGNGIAGNEFNFQIRGYRNAQATRDYFPTLLSADSFNVERIEVARGPNSLIFGVGGPGGIVNATYKSAVIGDDRADVTLRVGSWGEERASFDYNKTLIEDVLAVRANGLYQRADGWKDFARNDAERGALAITYSPLENTRIKFNTEFGSMEQIRVRPWAPVDQVLMWELQGENTYAFGTPESPWVEGDTNYTQTRAASGGSPANGLDADIPDGLTFERRSAHLGNPLVYLMDGPLANKLLHVGQRNEGKRYYRVSYNNNINGYNTPSFVLDESIVPRSANPLGPGDVDSTDYTTFSATIDQRIGQNFNLNLTAATTNIDRRDQSITGFAGISYKLDVTSQLPTFNADGTYNATEGGPDTDQGTGTLNFNEMVANPFLLNPIFSYDPSYQLSENTQDDIRLSANYDLELGDIAGNHRIMGFVQRSETGREGERFREANMSPNRPNTDRWLNGNNWGGRDVHIDFFSDDLAMRGAPDPFGEPLPDSIIWGAPDWGDFQHGWFRDNLFKSETQIDSMALAVQSRFFKNSLVTTAGVRRDEVSIRNWSRISDSLGEAISLDPIAPQDETGDTYSIGVVYHTPLEWLSLTANKSTNFQTQGGAQFFEDEALRQSMEIGALRGTGYDFGVKTTLIDGKLYASLSYFDVSQSNASTGFDGNVTSYINAIWTTILNGGSDTQVTDAEDPDGHHVGGRETRSQAATGWELEIIANPTDNWRISFNMSDTENAVADLGNNLEAYINKHSAEWETWRSTPYDTGRSPGFLGDNTVGALIDGLDNLLGVIRAGEGVTETNVRPIIANMFTAYDFSDGPLRGLTIGGGVNYRGDQILGVNPATADNPVAEVFKGGDYFLANAMIGYGFEIGEIPVRLQLNVDNLFDNDDAQILASNYNIAAGELEPFYYYLDPRSWSLSATFSF